MFGCMTTRYRRFGEIAAEHGVVYIIEGLDGVCTYGKGCIQRADFNGCCCISSYAVKMNRLRYHWSPAGIVGRHEAAE